MKVILEFNETSKILPNIGDHIMILGEGDGDYAAFSHEVTARRLNFLEDHRNNKCYKYWSIFPFPIKDQSSVEYPESRWVNQEKAIECLSQEISDLRYKLNEVVK